MPNLHDLKVISQERAIWKQTQGSACNAGVHDCNDDKNSMILMMLLTVLFAYRLLIITIDILVASTSPFVHIS